MSKTIIFSKNITFMRWIPKKRRLIVIAVILCICFLIYQLISLKILNVQMSESNSIIKAKQDNQMSSVIQVNDHIIKPEINNEINDQNYVNEDIIIGVMPKFYSLYKENDLFRCLLSGEIIPYSYLNDDYCDCIDGSDEPSTNACPLNKFYCTKSFKNSVNFIPSNKVNDGICDCCDGSDETKGISPPLILTPSQIKTMKSSRKLVSSPPCPDRCLL